MIHPSVRIDGVAPSQGEAIMDPKKEILIFKIHYWENSLITLPPNEDVMYK
jgi:hypothetical protein